MAWGRLYYERRQMKKLLGISVVAMLAVSPMMANAAGEITGAMYTAPTHADSDAPTTDANPAFAASTIYTADQSHIASTAYVKGAYNSAIAAVNKVAANNTTSAGNGLTKDGTTFKVNLTTGANDAAASGLELTGTDGSKTLQAKVDTTSIEINSSGALGVKAGGITSTELDDDAVTTAKITNGNVTFAKVASADIVTSTTNTNGIRATDSASDSLFVTEKAVAKAVEAATSGASNALAQAGGDGIVWDSTNSELDIDLAGKSGLEIGSTGTDEGKLLVKAGDGIAINQTSGAVQVDLTTNGGLQVDSTNKTLEVKVNTGTMEVGANGIGIKNAGVDTEQIKNGAVTAAKLAPGVISSSVSTLASTDAGYDAWNGNATVASEKAVATEVANLKAGVAATIDAATIKLYTTWGNDTDAATGNAAAGTIDSSGYTQGS